LKRLKGRESRETGGATATHGPKTFSEAIFIDKLAHQNKLVNRNEKK
jgi:hypothetical protein